VPCIRDDTRAVPKCGRLADIWAAADRRAVGAGFAGAPKRPEPFRAPLGTRVALRGSFIEE
jgi:hypothetical protein